MEEKNKHWMRWIWLGVVVGIIFIGSLMGYIAWKNRKIGVGYVVWGRGLKIEDKDTWQRMIASARESAGFYHPWIILRVREGVREESYPLFIVDSKKRDGLPLTGCTEPKMYGARSIAVINMDVDYNKIIVARGEEGARAALEGIVEGCVAYVASSGDKAELYQAVRASIEKESNGKIVIGAE